MNRTLFVAMAVLILVCPVAWASDPVGTIAGTVLDSDGQGFPGVLVTVSGAGVKLSAATGYGGSFSISNVGPGTYKVVAELDGFEPTSVEEVLVKPGATAQLQLAFAKPSFHEMMEVTARHDTMTTTQVRESAARDVGEAMGEYAGITKVRKGGIANDISIRGLQRDNINVLIDGARIYGACPNRMDVAAFHVDFSEVEHIEVVKGPFDIENQGSLGGVVNIVTRQPEPDLHGTGVIAGGSDGFFNPSVTVSWGSPKFSTLAGYSYRTSGSYRDAKGRPFTEVANYSPRYRDTDAFQVSTSWFKLFASPWTNHTLNFSYTRQEADRILYPTLQMDAGWDNTDRMEFGWQKTDETAALSKVRVRAYGTRVRHWMSDVLRTTGGGTPRGWSMGTMADASTIGVKAEAELYSLRVGVDLLRRGWDAATQMAKMGYQPQASIPNVITTTAGVFASHHGELADRVRFDIGGRIDNTRTAADPDRANKDMYFAYNSTRETSRSDTLPSASVRFTWEVMPRLTLATGLGHTTRIPDPAERYFSLKRAGSDWVGNPELRPVRNTGVDVAATWQRDRGVLTASLFYQSLRDWITVYDKARVNMAPGVMNTTARSYTNVNARLWGGELELNHAFTDRIFFAGMVTWTRGEKDTDAARNISSRNMAEMPPLASRLSLRYDTGRFYAETEGVFASAQNDVDTDLFEERTAGWGILNLKFGTTLASFRIQATVGNVFNRNYQEHLSCVRDPYHAGIYISEPGRTLSMTVTRRL